LRKRQGFDDFWIFFLFKLNRKYKNACQGAVLEYEVNVSFLMLRKVRFKVAWETSSA